MVSPVVVEISTCAAASVREPRCAARLDARAIPWTRFLARLLSATAARFSPGPALGRASTSPCPRRRARPRPPGPRRSRRGRALRRPCPAPPHAPCCGGARVSGARRVVRPSAAQRRTCPARRGCPPRSRATSAAQRPESPRRFEAAGPRRASASRRGEATQCEHTRLQHERKHRQQQRQQANQDDAPVRAICPRPAPRGALHRRAAGAGARGASHEAAHARAWTAIVTRGETQSRRSPRDGHPRPKHAARGSSAHELAISATAAARAAKTGAEREAKCGADVAMAKLSRS